MKLKLCRHCYEDFEQPYIRIETKRSVIEISTRGVKRYIPMDRFVSEHRDMINNTAIHDHLPIPQTDDARKKLVLTVPSLYFRAHRENVYNL